MGLLVKACEKAVVANAKTTCISISPPHPLTADVVSGQTEPWKEGKLRGARNTVEKKNCFLQENMAYLKNKTFELLDLVAKLTFEIQAEGNIYRRKYFSERRQSKRLKQTLRELNGDALQEDDYKGVNGDDLEGASALALLATEANEVLVREMEPLEGMANTVGPSIDPAKPSKMT